MQVTYSGFATGESADHSHLDTLFVRDEPRRPRSGSRTMAPSRLQITISPLLTAPRDAEPIEKVEKTRRSSKPGLQALSGAMFLFAPSACESYWDPQGGTEP